jgi:hypothetical protein
VQLLYGDFTAEFGVSRSINSRKAARADFFEDFITRIERHNLISRSGHFWMLFRQNEASEHLVQAV